MTRWERMKPIIRRLNPLRPVRRLVFTLRNRLRRRNSLEYVTLLLPAQMPALPESRGWVRRRVLGSAPLSLVELDRMLEQIGDDPRPKGVILQARGLAMGLADLQTLRGSIERLRGRGKRVIFFAQRYSNGLYYLASAADEIVLQPGGEIETTGLRTEAVFVKDALDTIGLQVDSVAISPYKGALDMFTRSDISEQGREQLDWLLDSQHTMWITGIAQGRNLTVEAVQAMIDEAPHLDEAALAAGYVDAVETEEDLHRRLASKHILTWAQASRRLQLKWREPAQQYVALLRVSGLMVPGESRRSPINLPIPFVGGERAGDLTVTQQVRQIMRDPAAVAVVLYIDSGGGSADAAEAMTAALRELSESRPMVVYMHGVAASGGYYIATPARWIVAQSGTITGSIGVITAKIVSGGLYGRLQVRRLEFGRGANAGFMSELEPFSDAQRARARDGVERVYRQFVGHVARGRKLTPEAVDAVGGGRVWTGTQAKDLGLVDELGDLKLALKKARELAEVSDDVPLVLISGKGKPLVAQLAEQANPAAFLVHAQENLMVIGSGRPLMLMPMEWKVSG